MSTRPTTGTAVLALASLIVLAACSERSPTAQVTEADHSHGTVLHSAHAPPEVQRTIAELRRWSAPFHNLDKAFEANYTVNIGCIDETMLGVDPSVARGMGYHLTRGDEDIVDGRVDIFQPQFLVYAPHPNEADMPKEERLGAARLAGFDYFVPGVLWPHADPPEFFGEPFHWSEAFQGWMRHIYLWVNNPEGMFEDWNAKVPLCAELLSP